MFISPVPVFFSSQLVFPSCHYLSRANHTLWDQWNPSLIPGLPEHLNSWDSSNWTSIHQAIETFSWLLEVGAPLEVEVEDGTEAAEEADGTEAAETLEEMEVLEAQLGDAQDVATLEKDPWVEEVEATIMKMEARAGVEVAAIVVEVAAIVVAIVVKVLAIVVEVEDQAVATTAAAQIDQTWATVVEVPVGLMMLGHLMQTVSADTRAAPQTTLAVMEPLDLGTLVVEVGRGVPSVDVNSLAKSRAASQRPPSWASCRPT